MVKYILIKVVTHTLENEPEKTEGYLQQMIFHHDAWSHFTANLIGYEMVASVLIFFKICGQYGSSEVGCVSMSYWC